MRHVALLIETSHSYGRGVLHGVRRYTAEHGPWSMFVEQRALESGVPPWLMHWRGDGILTRTNSQAMADAITRVGVPTVELRSARVRRDFPFVGNDSWAIGRQVAEHLLERGFRQFGALVIESEVGFLDRRDEFLRTIAAAGGRVAVYSAPGRGDRPTDWERQQVRLAAWLAKLPKPVGVMACTDQLGFWLLDACGRAGLAVPDEVAVVGVGDDETLCTLSHPPLSSVRQNAERIGYEAAAVLDRLMAGKSAPEGPIRIEPLGIVVRQSSDVVAVADADLAGALRVIRARACDGISTDDVLAEVPVSRSTLERRMLRVLGRTPGAEIVRVRLGHVKRLLTETNLSLAAVARKAGFRHPQYMSTLFKRKFGETPGAYRARCQG
jgi:LacI family transcriptional regulator